MKLTPEQQAVLDGSKGAVMAKVMKTLVMYGDAFGAEKMVPITSTYGHTVISFGAEIHRRPAPARQERPLESAAGSGVPQVHV